MPAPPLPEPILTQGGFCRVSVRGCELRYYRTGTGAPIVLLHPLRAQLEYFAPLLRHLNTARFAVIAPTCPGTASRERPARTTRPLTSPKP